MQRALYLIIALVLVGLLSLPGSAQVKTKRIKTRSADDLTAEEGIARARDPGMNKSLKGAKLNDADLSNTDLLGADLSRANLKKTILVNARMCRANLKSATLDDAILGHADLRYATLINASAKEADFSYANLSGASLMGADLSKALFFDANLSDANMQGATTNNAQFTRAIFSPNTIMPDGQKYVAPLAASAEKSADGQKTPGTNSPSAPKLAPAAATNALPPAPKP